ncbi:hypothetical protein PIN31115_04454 [Pandoraea iniqua]|uniref:Leucine Rich repeats (2 copies) n=1 Tax=Pandoraea iniqua TaxID=2508288 RepID=A0A5E4YES2_9BURK|nr:hypothetical protein [Pandoraea iniqua]VVE47214.1 hypothetical protein PIN31115_04454 [Pandoraea iniqua]
MHPIWERADGRRLLLNPHLGTAKEFKALSEVNHSFRHHLFEAKRSTRVTNERQLAVLSQRFPRVRCVTLDRLNLTGRDLAADLPREIRELALVHCCSDDVRWMESLRTLPLQKLSLIVDPKLYQSPVFAEVLEHLRHVGTLQQLEFKGPRSGLDFNNISDFMRPWMEGIARLTSLQTLALPPGDYFSGYSEWQPVCAGLPQLQYLIVPANNADCHRPAHLLTLMGFSQLRALDLSETRPSAQVLEAIAQHPSLRALSVRVDSKASVQILSRCSSLEVLRVEMDDFPESDLGESIKSLASLPNLRDLVVSGNYGIGPDVVRALCDNQSLQSLSVEIDESCTDDPELAMKLMKVRAKTERSFSQQIASSGMVFLS